MSGPPAQVYTLLGKEAENAFSEQWAVCYAMDNISQFQDIAISAMQAALIVMILDRLRLVNPVDWLQSYCDALSVQAALAVNAAAQARGGWVSIIAKHVRAMARVGGG